MTAFIWLALLAIHPAQAALHDLQGLRTQDVFLNTAPTGCQPKGMKADLAGRYLYVAEMCGKRDPQTKERVPTASIYDLTTRSLVKTLITPVGAQKGIFANTEVDFSLDGRWALIARAEGDAQSSVFPKYGMVSVVNTATQKIAKYIPVHGKGSKIIAARPYPVDPMRRQVIYVANYFSDDISVLDVKGLEDDGHLDGSQYFVKRVRLQTSFRRPDSKSSSIAPRGIAFTPDGNFALILSTETGSLILFDSLEHRQLAELAPMSVEVAGREVNLRHIVVSSDGKVAYLSHMRGNGISRINVEKLIQIVRGLLTTGPKVTLPAKVWEEILIPFPHPSGTKKILILEDYPLDHPNFPGARWELAHPNTIVLDPRDGRYLYVSHRTSSHQDYRIVDPKVKGKIDIVDTTNGQLVFSLVGGAQPTALEISRDGRTLISSGFKDQLLYFYDLQKIRSLYEQ